MSEIILVLVIFAQWGVYIWSQIYHREKENKLMNAVLAKNPQQLVDLTIADKIKPQPEPQISEDLIPENQLTDEEFQKLVIERNK